MVAGLAVMPPPTPSAVILPTLPCPLSARTFLQLLHSRPPHCSTAEMAAVYTAVYTAVYIAVYSLAAVWL